MELEPAACYRALAAKDARFDGSFFVGVSSTGIYCRCVCSARCPKEENCTFYANPATAEHAGFRPCLLCRPELAPGRARVDAVARLATNAVRRIEDGALADCDLSELARDFGVSDRHLRRVIQQEFGVTPIELAQTQRLLAAKQLLTDTQLPVGEVAIASGFSSLRRFNHLFQQRYQLRPSDIRKTTSKGKRDGGMICHLSYRPPYDYPRLVKFLGSRAVGGVESLENEIYHRSVRLGSHTGWLTVEQSHKPNSLKVTVSPTLAPVLPRVLARIRHLFDTGADPIAIHETLGELGADRPGLRIPGAFDGFEVAVRAILGQQVSVKAATTLSGRLAARFGEPIETPFSNVTSLFPTPQCLAVLSEGDIAQLGIVGARSRAIIGVAKAVSEGTLKLIPGADSEETVRRLEAMPGLGPWTAQYIAMRALAWPDAFMPTDLGIMKAMNEENSRRILDRAEVWRPWRSYAGFHLWACLEPAS